jgi:uncharacterized damage-inducible protein DinB
VLEDSETRKDTVQVAVENAFHHVGQIAGIIAGAGREVTRELGDWATEVFEMRDAARRARADRTATGQDDPLAPPGD